MRKLTTFFFFLSLVVGLFYMPQSAEATETSSGYSITILKYKLSDGVSLSEDVPIDGTKVDQVTDANGNELEPLAGVSYEVIRVSPTEGTDDFQPIEGVDAFSVTITTDAAGVAYVGNLAAGTYRVSEKPTDTLLNVMEPVTFELPLPHLTGEALSDVYLYPKSSVQVLPKTPGTPAPVKDPIKESTRRLPQTSGTLGSIRPLYFILVLILVMGAIGGYFMKSKKGRF